MNALTNPIAAAREERRLFIGKIQQQTQRQDGLLEQLQDLRIAANKLGMYDAADYLRNVVERIERQTDNVR